MKGVKTLIVELVLNRHSYHPIKDSHLCYVMLIALFADVLVVV